MNRDEALAALKIVVDTDYDDWDYTVDGATCQDLSQCLVSGVLGFCGCGDHKGLLQLVKFGLTTLQSRPNSLVETHWRTAYALWETKRREVADDHSWQLLLYVLDARGLTEHGTSIGGSWLTDKGRALLTLIDEALA